MKSKVYNLIWSFRSMSNARCMQVSTFTPINQYDRAAYKMAASYVSIKSIIYCGLHIIVTVFPVYHLNQYLAFCHSNVDTFRLWGLLSLKAFRDFVFLLTWEYIHITSLKYCHLTNIILEYNLLKLLIFIIYLVLHTIDIDSANI